MSRTVFADDDIDLDVRFVSTSRLKTVPLMVSRYGGCSDSGICPSDPDSGCTNFCTVTKAGDGCSGPGTGCTGCSVCPM
jgi:hypothetical protein